MHVNTNKKQKLFDIVMTKGKSTAKAIESDESDEEDPELLFPEDQVFAKGGANIDISSTVKSPNTKKL